MLKNNVIETVEGRVLLRGGPAFLWLLMTGRRMMVNDRPFLLGIGIDITARKQAEEALHQSHQAALNLMTEAVEARERSEQMSQALQQKYDELERINNVMVGRELRMIELKVEINALLTAAGQPDKYKIVP